MSGARIFRKKVSMLLALRLFVLQKRGTTVNVLWTALAQQHLVPLRCLNQHRLFEVDAFMYADAQALRNDRLGKTHLQVCSRLSPAPRSNCLHSSGRRARTTTVLSISKKPAKVNADQRNGNMDPALFLLAIPFDMIARKQRSRAQSLASVHQMLAVAAKVNRSSCPQT